MVERVELSVVLPAYREAGSLAMLLPPLLKTLAHLSASFEVLVVDTQRPLDDTEAVCRRYGVTCLHRRGGDRYGDAVRTGIADAGGEYVLFMDADGSHNPDAIPAMWLQGRQFDIVIGSRYVPGGHTENGPLLVAMSRLLCLTCRLVLPFAAQDVSTSFRLYRADILRALALEADGFDILQEMLFDALNRPGGARVIEIPVTFGRRTAGTSKRRLFSLALAYLKTLVRLRIATRSGPKCSESP